MSSGATVPGGLRSYTIYDYDSPGNDCPRLTDTRLWAASWNGLNGVPAEIVTQFTLPPDGSHLMNVIGDNTVYKEFYGSGWQNGLVTRTEVYAGEIQKWTTTSYTQDNLGVTYQTNPRVTATDISDPHSSRHTTIDYDGDFGLPSQVTEYDGITNSAMRRTAFEYVNKSGYPVVLR